MSGVYFFIRRKSYLLKVGSPIRDTHVLISWPVHMCVSIVNIRKLKEHTLHTKFTLTTSRACDKMTGMDNYFDTLLTNRDLVGADIDVPKKREDRVFPYSSTLICS